MCDAKLVLEAGKQALAVTSNEDSRWECYPCEEAQPQTFYCESEESTLTVFMNYIEGDDNVTYPFCHIMLVLSDAGYHISHATAQVKMRDVDNPPSKTNAMLINIALVGVLDELSKQVGYVL